MSLFGHSFKLSCCFRRRIPLESSPTERLCRVRFLRRQPCLTMSQLCLSCDGTTTHPHTKLSLPHTGATKSFRWSDNGPRASAEHISVPSLAITRHRQAKSAFRRFEPLVAESTALAGGWRDRYTRGFGKSARKRRGTMAKVCEVCGKTPVVGRQVSHAHNVSARRFEPNLQVVRAMINGGVRRIRVCTRCLRSNKVVKAA